jgi:hypothetical protein
MRAVPGASRARATRDGAVLLALLVVLAGCSRPAESPGRASSAAGSGAVVEALYAQHARDAWTECRGAVVRLLPDDTRPPRHERFLVQVAGGDGLTILVAHNIDLAPRAPVAPGDTVELRGEYEWNAQGGVLHETHHATSARAVTGGWVRVRGVTYQ